MISKQIRQETLSIAQLLIIHGPRTERKYFALLLERPDDPGMAVALVDRGVAGDEIEVLLLVHVPDVGPAPSRGDHRNRFVVVTPVNQLFFDAYTRFFRYCVLIAVLFC
jgi:hypothetical protein